jgi:Zn-dependent peptidase ImmA (M78 family)
MIKMADEMQIVRQFMAHPPVDIEGMIHSLGIEYERKEMADGESGRIERTPSGYKIIINEREGIQRKRFTAAHELSHYLLHRDLLKDGHLDRLYVETPELNPSAPFSAAHEVQANNMAANILMPRSQILSRWVDGERLPQLAETFGVSRAAMKVRLKVLGLDDTIS